MTKRARRYVGKAEPDGTWRIWNKTARKFWGESYHRRPDALIDELNGEKRPDILTRLSRDLQIKQNQKTLTRRV